MKYFGATDKGKIRENNEDFLYACDELFIVADGMGGHKAGEVASKLAVEAFLEYFNQKTKKKNNIPPRSVKKILSDAVRYANASIFKESLSNPDCSGMGTTFTACYSRLDIAHIIHVGDTRVYQIRNKSIDLITSDHTFVGEMFRRGEISYEDTFAHPQRNYLTNVLGMADDIKTDYYLLKVTSGDRLILCSDGLNSMLRDDMILKISERSENPEIAASSLVSQANKLGGKDNISVIVIDF